MGKHSVFFMKCYVSNRAQKFTYTMRRLQLRTSTTTRVWAPVRAKVGQAYSLVLHGRMARNAKKRALCVQTEGAASLHDVTTGALSGIHVL